MYPPRVWFITGASSGFGLEITKIVLTNGDCAVATYRSSSEPPSLSDLRNFTDAKANLLPLSCDVSLLADVQKAFSLAEKFFGHVDIVFNNAGIALLGEIEGTPEDQARQMFDVNFWGMTHVSREAIRVFRDVNKVQGGRLLNMSSGAGVVPNAGIGYYSASKHALEGFTEALAKEMDPSWNIKITIVEPGAFRTRAHTDNTTTLPPHPSYALNPNLASNQVRQWFLDRRGIKGDVILAAKRIYHFVQVNEDGVPMRLQLGDDSWHGIKTQLEAVIQEQRKYKHWSENLS